ncbi:MAG TPA: LysE family transporter [Hyphomicrobiaceae bacterium]|nr:LysE family transporter [Hyphomicrobiaceae bacterium]
MTFLPNPLIIPAGIMIGVLIAMPVGPVNLLCLQRSLERGFWGGVAAGLGVVIGDGLIALFAALGVGAVTGVIRHYRMTVQTIGGLALVAFGIRLYFTRPQLHHDEHIDGRRPSLAAFAWDIPQTFFLTITNPGAVLGLFAIFGGVSSYVQVETYIDAFTMVAAIMGGSLLWWIVLSHTISRFRHHMDVEMLRLLNRLASLILLGFGGLLLSEVAMKFISGRII